MFKILAPSKKGLKVFDPATKLHLPDDGKKIKITPYWMRRLSCGDVVEILDVVENLEKKNNKKPKGGI